MSEPPISRRSVLRGALVTVVAGVAGYFVAAHSSAAKNGGVNPYDSSTATGHLLTEVDHVPLGGGIVVASAEVVVIRSQSGAVHGLSAICTHLGCTVGAPEGGVITCPCHGSQFNAQTGAVLRGPATKPLPAVAVLVKDGDVYSQ
jgi:Rieske Fe-S protein